MLLRLISFVVSSSSLATGSRQQECQTQALLLHVWPHRTWLSLWALLPRQQGLPRAAGNAALSCLRWAPPFPADLVQSFSVNLQKRKSVRYVTIGSRASILHMCSKHNNNSELNVTNWVDTEKSAGFRSSGNKKIVFPNIHKHM